MPATPPAELIALRSAVAVRERCAQVRDWVAQGRSPHFTLDTDRLDATAAFVAEVTRASYPDLAIPHHSRWRHFSAGEYDRWSALPLARLSAIERARAAVDLTVVSVLLDAGAGSAWRYREAETGIAFTRSEGLAVASFAMFRDGLFSSNPDQPLSVDRTALAGLAPAALAAGFQASERNPLVGLSQRLDLLGRRGVARGLDRSRRSPGAAPRCTREHLAVRAHGRGRRARRCRPPPRRAHGGSLRRHRSVPQAVAVARLFADRAARAGRRNGRRSRRAHRSAGISQWRAFGRHGRDRAAHAARPGRAARRRLRADRRMARADRRAPRCAARGDAALPRARDPLHVAAAAERKLERRPDDRAGQAAAGRAAADRRPGGRNGVLNNSRSFRSAAKRRTRKSILPEIGCHGFRAPSLRSSPGMTDRLGWYNLARKIARTPWISAARISPATTTRCSSS